MLLLQLVLAARMWFSTKVDIVLLRIQRHSFRWLCIKAFGNAFNICREERNSIAMEKRISWTKPTKLNRVPQSDHCDIVFRGHLVARFHSPQVIRDERTELLRTNWETRFYCTGQKALVVFFHLHPKNDRILGNRV